MYAEEHELYTFLIIKNSVSQMQTLGALTACVDNVRPWTALNTLQLNDEKTEFMTICYPQYHRYICTDSLTVGATEVTAVPRSRNLDVVINQVFSLTITFKGFVKQPSPSLGTLQT